MYRGITDSLGSIHEPSDDWWCVFRLLAALSPDPQERPDNPKKIFYYRYGGSSCVEITVHYDLYEGRPLWKDHHPSFWCVGAAVSRDSTVSAALHARLSGQ